MQFHCKRILFILPVLFFSFFSFSQEKINTYIISGIEMSGNKITKQDIVLRELLFNIGDTVSSSEINNVIELSRENLLNTSLFNFVTINYGIDSLCNLKVEIDLQERWYIWPYPVLEYTEGNLSTFLNNKEWSRIDYGIYVLINNFRGRKEILKLKSIFGYNNRFVLFYNKPFIDKQKKTGLGFDIDYFRNHEIAYQISDDELVYLKLNDEFVQKTLKLSTFLSYRPFLYTNHQFTFRYTNVNVSDSVIDLNPDYLYGENKDIEFITLAYKFNYDKRDSKVYPLHGFKFNTSVIIEGLGLYSEEGTFYLKSAVEDNFKIANRLYFNAGVEGKISFDSFKSYYFSEAIGFKNYIRGMEYYTILGKNYYISKTNLKYELIPQSAFNLNFISTDKFSKVHYALYLNLFFDTGYVNSEFVNDNMLVNEFLYSGGIGIDFVTYYDKVLRIEYSLNKFGEHGFFIHLGAPIIEN